MTTLPIKPDPRLVVVCGPYLVRDDDETLAAQVECALEHDWPFRVVRARRARVGFFRRRTVTIIDEVEFS